jgi:putative RNA 2'-phosphotransferase
MNDKEKIKKSKFLSLVLRHEPQSAGVTLDEAGWVSVAELLEGCRRNGVAISREQLQVLVDTSDKKRFALSDDGLRIRANQGHSVEVDLKYEPARPSELLYHGTATRFAEAIRASGLQKMNRHHVHLSLDYDTALKVGQRHGKPLILTVLSAQMHADGHLFYVSANGVWLTDNVAAKYLKFPD